MLKSKTLWLLKVARSNKQHPIYRPMNAAERMEMATEIRRLQRDYGHTQARDMHRAYYGSEKELDEGHTIVPLNSLYEKE